MIPRNALRALVALALFAMWSYAAFIGVGHGSRRSVWLGGPYGAWPTRVVSVLAGSPFQMSIFASYTDPLRDGA